MLNVRDPASPPTTSFLSMHYREGGLDDGHEVVAAADYPYLDIRGDYNGVAAIVDVSQPSEPELLHRHLRADYVAWDDNRLFLAVFDAINNFSHNLQAF